MACGWLLLGQSRRRTPSIRVEMVAACRKESDCFTGDSDSLQIRYRSQILVPILLAFLFRATTLHLRPVEIASLPCRLTVLSILLLTTAVAIELATDAPTYQNVWTQVINRPQNLFYILFAFLDHAMTALVWFSTAWLFVARNPMRWIGIVGLVVYLIFSGHYCFIIEPLDIPAIGPLYYGGLFAVIIFHLSVSFLSLGMMHLAGYRWDILANSAWSRRSVSR